MTAEQKLTKLAESALALLQVPIMQLAENKGLVKEIKETISSRNFQGIVNDIMGDRRLEKITAMNGGNQIKSTTEEQGEHLLKSYVKYQSAAYNVLSKGSKPKMTQYTSKPEAMAFNAKKENPFKDKRIVELKETKEFASAFNSIYSDHGLQIGTINDPTQIQSYIDYSPYIWNYKYYLAIPTLSQTIDLPISMATRKLPRIIFDEDDLTEKFNLFVKRSRIIDRVKKMLFYSSMSPRGSLIVPIDNGDGNIRYNIFNDTQFTYTASQQYSTIDFHDSLSGVSQLFCLGNILQNEVTAHFLCPGFEPIYAIGKNRVFQLKEAAEAINIYLFTIKVLCVRAQVLIQTADVGGQTDSKLEALMRATRQINSELSLSTAVNLPPDSKLDILSNNFSPGFSEVQPIIKEFQGLLTGMMPDYLYGSQTAYSANSFNLQVTHQNIRSMIQESQIEPIFRFIINTQLKGDKDFKPWANQVDNFDIEFESLYESTETEKLANDKLKIENLIAMRDYPELKDAFMKENLWREDIDFPDEPPTEMPMT